MASAAGPSFGGLASGNDGYEGSQTVVRRGGRRADQAPPSRADWTPAEMAVSVPELTGHLHLPHPAHPGREWATARGRYRVRAGWHIAHISDNLVDLLLLVDGHHTVAEIAAELERRQQRPVHPSEVAYLLRERLSAAGLVRLRRGRLFASPTRIPAFAAPSAPLAIEAPAAASAETLAAPLAAAAVVQAPAPPAPPAEPPAAVAPAASLPDAPTADAATHTIPVPASERAPDRDRAPEALPPDVPPAAPPPPVPDEPDPEETLNLAELGLGLALAPSAAPGSPAEASERTGQNSPGDSAVVTHPDLDDDEPPAAPAPTVEPDDAPTLVLPRDLLPLSAPTRDLTLAPRAEVLPPAAPPPARPQAGRVVDAARRRALAKPLLLVAGIALLVLLAAFALRGSLAGLVAPRAALQPTATLAPAATATPTPPQARILPGESAYTVRPGDTLKSVAAQVHISADALALVNADVLDSSGTLATGMRLAVPATYRPGVSAAQQPRPLYYTLRPGDTLYQIGQRFGMDWHTIATYNHISDQYSLSVGQGIIIPAQP